MNMLNSIMKKIKKEVAIFKHMRQSAERTLGHERCAKGGSAAKRRPFVLLMRGERLAELCALVAKHNIE